MAISRLDMERQLRNMGGIMSLEEPRQGYFLGKLVKKAAKTVKKVVKSPIGKAAILGAIGFGIPGTQFGGILGKGALTGLKGKMLGLPSALKNMSFAKKLGLIGGTSGLAGLLAAQEEDDVNFSDFDRGEGLNIPDIIKRARMNDPEFRFLPGAQFTDAYAEGGEVGLLSGRPRYQTGGDVAYDASDKDIYGSSAMTITPDTVMDQFGNQVQSELGNDFNKPLIPQVTEEVTRRMVDVRSPMPVLGNPEFERSISRPAGSVSLSQFTPPETPISMQTPLPGSGGIGGLGKIDMPIAGGNNNVFGQLPVMPRDGPPPVAGGINTEMGILPVMPRDGPPENLNRGPVMPQDGSPIDEIDMTRPPGTPSGNGALTVMPQYNDPLPKDQLLSGFEQFKRDNPEVMRGFGTTAMVPVTLPGGYSYDFSGSLEANAFRKYLKSIGQAPAQGRQDSRMLAKLASGGIARMLGRVGAAEGGIMNLGGNEMDLRGGGFVPLGAKEKADDVPARLSKNEFVMTADAVRAAGGGSVDKGADKMYNMMKNLEAQV